MKHAIQELMSIASMAPPQTEKLINEWIQRHIGISSQKILLHHPEDPKHQEYRLKQAMHNLGVSIAENSNMYPKFEPVKGGFECRVETLYFKNEFGK